MYNYWQAFIILSEKDYFPNLLSLANVFLIFLTVVVAYLSWKAAKKANEFQVLPLLAVYFKGSSLEDRSIRIKNIGKSPAYDIKIESFVNIITDIQNVWELEMFISGTNVLIPNEENILTLRATNCGKPANIQEFMIFHLDPEQTHNRKRISLVLTFRNAEGSRYYALVETGIGGLYVQKAKRLNLTGKLFLGKRKLSAWTQLQRYKIKWKFTNPHIERPKKNGD